MSKTSTNQELIDGVFSELYVKSRIVINCRCGSDPDIFTGEVPLKIKTVNRCKTPEEFGEQMLLAGHQLIGRALALVAGLSPGESLVLLREVAVNFEPLIRETLQAPAGQEKKGRNGVGSQQQWLFNFFVTNVNDSNPLPLPVEASIRALSWRYAFAWHRAMKKTRKEIMRLASLILWIPVRTETEPRPEQEPRVVVNSNITRLAFLARVFYEKKSFGINNKTELCIALCKNFTTPTRDALSPVSFKNKFDCPDKEAIAYWKREFEGLLQITLDIENRYN